MISVILPVYNREKTIQHAIQSVLDQTYRDIELIVVDDGSTDETCAIVTAFKDPRIRLLHTETNQGACKARNLGISNARGEWVAFQDSDDIWKLNKLEKQLHEATKCGCDVIFCSMHVYQIDGTLFSTVPDLSFHPGICTYEKLLVKSYASTQTILGRRDCFIAEPFNETLPRMQDWDIILRLAQNFKIWYMNEVLVDTHLQRDSLTLQTENGLIAHQSIYSKNKTAIEGDPKIKAAHIALDGYLLLLSGKNPADFYWKNISPQFGLKYNSKFILKAILASLGILPKQHSARKMQRIRNKK